MVKGNDLRNRFEITKMNCYLKKIRTPTIGENILGSLQIDSYINKC